MGEIITLAYLPSIHFAIFAKIFVPAAASLQGGTGVSFEFARSEEVSLVEEE
jgi:hypothetical protein